MATCRTCLVDVDSLNTLTISYPTSIVELQDGPNGETLNVCDNCNTSISEMLTKLNE